MLKGYFGTPGSGKTYEVVENVILGALRSGRRVVTNVAGLDREAITDYLVEQGCDESKLGHIVQIQVDEETAGKLAIIEGDGEHAKLNPASIVQGGDVLVLDEVWRIWEDGKKLHEDDRKFLRMHRHLLHPDTNVACDVVIISQAYADVHRGVRRLIEERFEMTKHIALGMSKRYRVDIYAKGARRPHVTLQRKYEPRIFSLYKSHSMGNASGKEISVDTRGNALGRFLRTVLPGALVAIALASYPLYRFFHQGETVQTAKIEDPKAAQAKPGNSALPPGAHAPDTKEKEKGELDDISEIRVAGYVAAGDTAVLFLDIGTGAPRQVVLPADGRVFGQYVEFHKENKAIGTFSGRKIEKREGRREGER